jgi:hypothetical protein
MPSSFRRLVVTISLLHMLSTQSSAATVAITVATTGSDVPGCGLTSKPPCRTLRAAVANTLPTIPPSMDVVISLGPGTFTASSCGSTIDRDVSVIGAGVGVTILDCNSAQRAFAVTSANLFVQFMTIRRGFANDSSPISGSGGCILHSPTGLRYRSSRTGKCFFFGGWRGDSFSRFSRAV